MKFATVTTAFSRGPAAISFASTAKLRPLDRGPGGKRTRETRAVELPLRARESGEGTAKRGTDPRTEGADTLACVCDG